MKKFRTLVDLLGDRAGVRGRSTAFTFLDHSRLEVQERAISFTDLDRRARSIGAVLSCDGRDREPVLLLFAPGIDYVAAFFGALYGGAIPVPAYPPHPARLQRMLPRLISLLVNSGARRILTTSDIAAFRDVLRDAAPELAACEWIVVDELEDESSAWRAPDVGPDDVCFLQYTSGSTSEPKGVMVTHANLLANQEMIASAMGNDESTVGVSWLPMYHDMGLIGHIIQPIYLGIHSVLMSPLAFLARPIRWLRAITEYRGTTSGGPNFAFDLCVRKIKDEDLSSLDLSSWRLAYSGAEPVRHDTLERFHARFEPAGLRWRSLFPCYGLAEATLLVSGGPAGAGPEAMEVDAKDMENGRVRTTEDGRQLVKSGVVAAEERVVIANPKTRAEAASDEVGEIWVQGPNVAAGYWRQDALTREQFQARLATGEGPFLRTGDLGFFSDSQLVVTGRLKDLVIVGGRNHYPQDIELSVEQCHPSVRRGCCAAFTIEAAGEERLVIAVEVERRYRPDRRKREALAPDAGSPRGGDRRQSELPPGNEPDAPARWDADEVVEMIRQAIWQGHELPVHAIVLVKPGVVPKTSSGKVRRQETRRLFLESELDPIALRIVGFGNKNEREHVPPQTAAEQLLAHIWQDVLGVAKVGREDVFVELGGDSVKAAQVVWKAKEQGLELSLQSMFEHPTLSGLAASASERATPPPPKRSSSRPPPSARPSPAVLEFLQRDDGGFGGAVVRAVDVQPERLREALSAVIDHHRELSSRLMTGPEGVYSLAARSTEGLVFEVDEMPSLSPTEEDQFIQQRSRTLAERLDRESGVRLAASQLLLPAGDGPRRASRLLLVADPCVVDEVSWWIVLDDLDRAYRCLEEKRDVRLPRSAHLEIWTSSVWERVVHAPRPATQLWTDQRHLRSNPFERRGAPAGGDRVRHRFHVGDMREAVESLVSADGISVLDLLSTAVLTAARDWCGGEDIRIGVHTSGRETLEHDVSRTVGLFATQEPLGVDLSGAETSAGALGIVSRHIGRLRELGVPFAALKHGHPDPNVRDLATFPEPAQLLLRYTGAADVGSALPRLGYATLVVRAPSSRQQVELTGSVANGALEIQLAHDPSAYDETDVRRFASACVTALRQIVKGSPSHETTKRFTEVSLDEGELNSVMARALAARRKK